MNESTTNKETAMNIKTSYTVQGDTVMILSGFSCFEVIDRSGKTISGNVIHVAKIRNRAIGLLNR
jgi:ketosteroid isomerase-like protein